MFSATITGIEFVVNRQKEEKEEIEMILQS